MLTTPHLLVGAAIGAQFNTPLEVAPLAAGSHFVLDGIPHLGNFIQVEDLEKKDIFFVVGDILLGLALLILLTNGNPKAELMWLGAFCAVLPDFHHIFQVVFGPDKLKRYTKAHRLFHYKKPISVFEGMATQIITVLGSLMLILIHLR